MSRTVNTVILCEDTQQEAFARRFLATLGIVIRSLRVEKSPCGRGAGEQFVRQRYPKEVAYYRSRQHRTCQALVVLVDADMQETADRLRQFETALESAGMQPRMQDERIAIIVPKRNIETWLAYLDGRGVDESAEYPKLDRERDCQRHVERLLAMCNSGQLLPEPPPSLLAACEEYCNRLSPSGS